MHRWFVAGVVCCLAAVGTLSAAELEARTIAAYEKYIAVLQQSFSQRTNSDVFLEHGSPQQLERLRQGEILLAPGSGDGITDAPGGLIHHWRATTFIAGVKLADVLRSVRNYSTYHSIYPWMIASELVAHEGDRYRAFFRMRRSAGRVTGVLDLWSVTDYRSVRSDRVASVSDIECVRQVENAGEQLERRLPPGTGKGYLWRAHTFSKYFERDGGVYIELDTVGLTRDYPAMLGWIIEPIARRLGRGSAADSLSSLRRVMTSSQPATAEPARVQLTRAWCGA
jgi:hypothetical protein